jgi:phosphoglycerol transferase
MKNWILNNTRIRQSSQYVAAAALCVLVLSFLLKLWHADLRVPFYYTGDSVFWAMCTKGVIENGWYWQNPAIGAPGILQMYEFPGLDNGVMALMWLISVFTHNPFVVMNLYYLLSFPLITVSSLYVLRHFNVSYVPALFVSLLYAFLPYHFMRNQHHIILNAYYVVPPAIMVLLWLTRELIGSRSRKFITGVVISILLGCSGVYYPFFFCFLLLVAGAVGVLKFRRLRPLAMAIVFAAITTVTVFVNLSPSFIYQRRHGQAGAMLRVPSEAESYGLRISQLLLPITVHRIPLFDRIKRYHNRNVQVSENDSASLGLVASIGFLGLLVQLLYRKELLTEAGGLLHDLSTLNIFAVLLATIGGIGLLFSLYISSAIRCYNRISVYIAFFSFMTVAYGLETIYRKASSTKSRTIFYVLLAAALIGASLDQTSRWYVPYYEPNKAEFSSDGTFVNQIEASMPAGAMIFQLPYAQFPEAAVSGKMLDYDHFRGYVHSKNLRWSYGTIKNRDTDRAQQYVASLPPEKFVQALAFQGFNGLYVDRFGYEDKGAAIEAEFSKILQAKPLNSPDGRLLFFNLSDYGRSLRQKYSDSEWEVKKELSFHPVLLDWLGGFSGLESGPVKTWRWCSNDGELHIKNTSRIPRTLKLEMAFATGYPTLDDFSISGLISEQLRVNFTPVPYSKTVTVPPGESVIYFHSAAKRIDEPRDTRFLVFRIEDFKLTELE